MHQPIALRRPGELAKVVERWHTKVERHLDELVADLRSAVPRQAVARRTRLDDGFQDDAPLCAGGGDHRVQQPAPDSVSPVVLRNPQPEEALAWLGTGLRRRGAYDRPASPCPPGGCVVGDLGFDH